MRDYQYLLFDLDGTLTDSGEGIRNSVAYALRKVGIEEEDKERLNKFIGPPLMDSLQKYYGFSREEARQGLQDYREYFEVKGIFENRVYDGIEALLGQLRDCGKQLIVATSKPELYARKILEHFGLDSYFYFISGATMDESRVNKEEVIAYALIACGIADKKQVLMIGDREHDILGAKENELDSMGVLYGFGDLAELEAAGADYIAETVEDIGTICQTK